MKFTKDPRDTNMYSWLDDQAFFFEDNALAYNSHDWGIDPAKFETDNGLREMFELTAISNLPDTGVAFSASMEGKKYPFFGTQFHPEMTS